ncbi:helix-turn-helix domain-containing protein [Mechercharimyces sp. CAU 1602]|uniref:helix-turn-helix domain-containing protein n=1 Tax=Mechercharimyces sp. CAU 1602 TaxID=2973933 RepID=UPI0021627CF7|nr:tetratricopeptide repeat protein [Mechercharimyces sp. CAU 1602]MCS1350419.1 tetratricopeptide repeat protein [Mechercharimyces sp. CAU 1602]
MDGMHTREIGEILRRIRKGKGLRLEDVADDNISPATVSNIERGVPHVLPGKVKYLMGRLETNEVEVKSLRVGVNEELASLKLKMIAIESSVEIGKVDDSLQKIQNFDTLSSEHPIAPYVYYLRGRCYRLNGQWDKAKRELLNAVRLSKNDPLENIEACAYNLLSALSFYQNNLEEAIFYTERGLSVFQQEGERDYILDMLLVNKLAYLEKLNRLGEAFALLNEVWARKETIKRPELLLHLYHLKVNLLRKTDHYNEAIEVGLEGVKRAQLVKEYNRHVDLWDALGSVYLRTEDLENAEICFESAMSFSEAAQGHYYFVSTLTKYGILYMRKGMWRASEEKLQEAIALGKELHADIYLIDAYVVMGDLKNAQAQYEDALVHYRHALGISDRIDLKKKKHAVLHRLTLCLQQTDQVEFKEQLANMFELKKELKEDEVIDEII